MDLFKATQRERRDETSESSVKLTSAGAQAAVPTGRDSMGRLAGWAFAFWVLWMAILPLGHVTALRTAMLLPVLGLAVAIALKNGGWRAISAAPALVFWLALIAWCSLSLLWSMAPDVSWSKLRFDLLIPFGAYVAAYIFGRFTGSAKYLLLGPVLGTTLLALMSLFAWIPMPAWLSAETQDGTFIPMPLWYPGVGEASAYATLLLGPLFAWWLKVKNHRNTSFKWAPLLVAVAIIAIIIATHRRNALMVPLFALALFFVLLVQNVKQTSKKLIAIVSIGFIVALLIIGALFEYGARQRIPPDERRVAVSQNSAALTLIKAEPRPRIWAWYLNRALEHPWIGVGFGRTVPAIAFGANKDKALLAIDSNAATHAHNIFFDWLLQTGLVGLAIFCALLIKIGRLAWRDRQFSYENRLLSSAVIVTIFTMLLRNMTDDFLVYGTAIMFWSSLGAMLGLLENQKKGL